jgi:hypothetical protein
MSSLVCRVVARLAAGVLPFDSLTSSNQSNHLQVIAGPGNYALGSGSDLRPRASCMGTPEAPSASCSSAGPRPTMDNWHTETHPAWLRDSIKPHPSISRPLLPC